MRRQPVPNLAKNLPKLRIKQEAVQPQASMRAGFVDGVFSVEDLIEPLAQIQPEFHLFPDMTLLELYARRGQWDFVIWAVKNLPELSEKSDHPITEPQQQQLQMIYSKLLLFAAISNELPAVSALLEMGALPDKMVITEGAHLNTAALDWAVYHRSNEMVAKLMSVGADSVTQLRLHKEFTPLELAVENAKLEEQYWTLIPALTNQPAKDTLTSHAYSRALLHAAIYGQTEVVIHLLSVGADPSLMVALNGECAGYTALHFAHRAKDPTMAMYLLAAGADPDLTARNGVSFRQLVTGKDELLAQVSAMPVQGRQTTATNLLIDCRDQERFPIRRPRLPGPTGMIVVLLAVKALLVELTIKICLVLDIASQKNSQAQPTHDKSTKLKLTRSLAADRFFAAQEKCRQEVKEDKDFAKWPTPEPVQLKL